MSDISKIRIDSGQYDIKDTLAVSSVARSGDTVTVLNRNGNSSTFSAKSILPSAVNIDGISFTGEASVHHYGTCSTSGATAEKAVTMTGTFSLAAGARVFVNFTNANTASSPSLNVASSGAQSIYYRGNQITTDSNKGLLEGVCEFIYDGTQWHLIGNTLLDSPAFSGTPTTPTALSGSYDNQIANTHFVMDAIADSFAMQLIAVDTGNENISVQIRASGLDLVATDDGNENVTIVLV